MPETKSAGQNSDAAPLIRMRDVSKFFGAFQALDDAQKVMITPGYGLAVAQAQGAAAEMANLLVKDGTEVTFGVHPVAGRMPGQLNVLLAEAGIPYDQVVEMEEMNEEMEECASPPVAHRRKATRGPQR